MLRMRVVCWLALAWLSAATAVAQEVVETETLDGWEPGWRWRARSERLRGNRDGVAATAWVEDSVARLDGLGGPPPRIVVTRFDGVSWASPEVVADEDVLEQPDGGVTAPHALAVDSSGAVWIVWQAYLSNVSPAAGNGLRVRVHDGTAWSDAEEIPPPSGASSPLWPLQFEIGTDGTAVILLVEQSWPDVCRYRAGSSRVWACRRTDGVWETPVLLTTSGGLARQMRAQLRVDAHGDAVAAFLHYAPGPSPSAPLVTPAVWNLREGTWSAPQRAADLFPDWVRTEISPSVVGTDDGQVWLGFRGYRDGDFDHPRAVAAYFDGTDWSEAVAVDPDDDRPPWEAHGGVGEATVRTTPNGSAAIAAVLASGGYLHSPAPAIHARAFSAGEWGVSATLEAPGLEPHHEVMWTGLTVSVDDEGRGILTWNEEEQVWDDEVGAATDIFRRCLGATFDGTSFSEPVELSQTAAAAVFLDVVVSAAGGNALLQSGGIPTGMGSYKSEDRARRAPRPRLLRASFRARTRSEPAVNTARSRCALAPGAELVLRGVRFGSLPGTLDAAGVPVAPTKWTDRRVTARVPDASGLVLVSLRRADGRRDTFNLRLMSPRVAAVNPSKRLRAGSVVTIRGSGFGVAQPGSASRVLIGETAIAAGSPDLVTWTDTRIRVRMPQGTGRTFCVVETAAGASAPIELAYR